MSRSAASVVEGDTALQSDVLEDLVSAVRYRRWLCSLGTPHLGDDVLEVGSGLGVYAQEWVDSGVAHLTATEADPRRLAQLHERFDGDPRVTVRELAVPIAETAEHSAVVAYNVLEHIADDTDALRAFRGLVRDGGAVVLVVPAFDRLMSRFDTAIGHQRRYTREGLAGTLRAAGLRVQRCHYVNAPGALAWWLLCTRLGRRPREGALLTAYDRLVVPVERRLEQRRPPPFGQSVFAVARR